jgi:hypothetical protein
MFSGSIIDDSRSIIGNSKHVTDDFTMTILHVASFTIIIYNHHILIIQVTGFIK